MEGSDQFSPQNIIEVSLSEINLEETNSNDSTDIEMFTKFSICIDQEEISDSDNCNDIYNNKEVSSKKTSINLF